MERVGSVRRLDSLKLTQHHMAGLINISHLRTGRKICTIRGHGDHDDSDEDVRSQALADVTSLFYCDRDNVLYSGNHRGDVFVWSRRGLGWKCDRAGGPT